DLEAQRLTTEAQLLLTTVALACVAAQATESRWDTAPAQSHAAATAARPLATSLRSGSVVGSHLARPGCTPARRRNDASTTRTVACMGPPDLMATRPAVARPQIVGPRRPPRRQPSPPATS